MVNCVAQLVVDNVLAKKFLVNTPQRLQSAANQLVATVPE